MPEICWVFPAEIAISFYESATSKINISIVKDISLKIELEKLSKNDHLTHILNRRGLDESLSVEISRAIRQSSPLTIIIGDIDHFKKINDQYGHLQGDMALVTLAEHLKQRTREVDIIGRYGGEEFLLICPNTNLHGAIDLAESIKSSLGSSLNDAKLGFNFTLSFGVAVFHPDDDEYSILGRADEALYCAKQSGRNRIHSEADLF